MSEDLLAAGILGVQGEPQVQLTPIFIPNEAELRQALEFFSQVGYPKQFKFYPEGVEVHMAVPSNQVTKVLPKASDRGYTIGGYSVASKAFPKPKARSKKKSKDDLPVSS